ncbi:fungal-specific transcription factor domain-containing protein [Aspergillus alliaceus]|uniref:Fungal-specific transcription factor domain-containing protein n=1 Tax=Petromyces alliaceus TaxID=209559 RepID=A0A5N7C6F5_PETAA|nr:fungal-specific transcription factor domain-containing protein [Aspergillus alliaceus]
MFACERCYSRKTKCDRRLPQCSSCTKSRSLCQYSNKRRDRHFQRGYPTSIETRLHELARDNEQLREHLSIRQDCGDSRQVHQPANRHSLPGSRPVGALHYLTQPIDPLSRTPGEELSYLGSSNGVDFVDVVGRVVDATHTGGLFGRMSASRGIPRRVALPPIPQSVVLVDEVLAMPLIKAYFSHWHLTFPLLHPVAFMQMVQRMYSDPSIYQRNAANAFVFDMVLALGSVASKTVEWSFVHTESHFTRALTHLGSLSHLRDIRLLQALLLYCKYGIHASLRDTSSDMWEVLGRATQLCVELGLHKYSLSILPKCETHLTGSIPASMQVELQRRCFWCYYNLERIVSISLGRPLALHDDDIHVPLPSAIDDDSLDRALMETRPPCRTVSPFLHHVRLRKIQAKIHRSMYTSRFTQALPLREKQAVRREIFSELQAWRHDVALLQLPSIDQSSVITSVFLHPNWYQALYYSGCLLLFRPSATFPATEGHESDEDINDVLQTIWSSSRHVLASYLDLLRSRHLNYSWVCLYTIFMAGLANVHSVGCCAQRRSRGIQAFLPSYLDVVLDVRDCSSILTAICERWDDARVSCDIFNQLSMSALKELAAVSFQQKHEATEVPEAKLGSNNTIGQQTSATAAHQQKGSARDNFSMLSYESSLPGCTDPATTLDGFLDGQLPNLSPVVEFQQLFQDLQSSIHTTDWVQANEVTLGFSQEWFER